MTPTSQNTTTTAQKSSDALLKDSTTAEVHSKSNPSLEFIKTLTNLSDIQECLRLLELEETQVDADLDELLAERENLEASLDKLEILE
jgi:hypothetical protein